MQFTFCCGKKRSTFGKTTIPIKNTHIDPDFTGKPLY